MRLDPKNLKLHAFLGVGSHMVTRATTSLEATNTKLIKFVSRRKGEFQS